MSSPFVAEIKMWAGNFAPTGYALCNGQLLPISQNTALFSLLGTFYGGDGKSTFALPDLQDSVPMNQGQGPGLSDRFIGEQSGVPYVTLLQTEMPLHTHTMRAYSSDPADTRTPNPNMSISATSPGNLFDPTTTGLVMMNPQALSITGGSLPHNNMMPFLTLTFIIALQGVFPVRG